MFFVEAQLAFLQRSSRTILLLACAAACVPVSALNPEHTVSQYIHTSWKSDSGLQAVRRLKQTPDGYLWLATRGGLVRFDGVRFSTYLAGTDDGPESSVMQDLLVDPDGSLWIATLGGGVAHYQRGKFRNYTSRDGLPSDDIGSLYRDARGVLWAGTRDGKIARLVGDRFEGVSLGIPTSPISAFVEDADQSLWIATFGNGVFRWQNGKLTAFSVKEGLPDARVAGLYRDPSGKVWTAGWKGVSSWDGARFVGNPEINAAVSYAISCTEDRDGNLWIAASSGLFRSQSGQVTKMDRGSGLSGDFVSEVFEDREGNLWIGTRGGLDRLRDGPVRTFTGREGLLPGPAITDSTGAVWTVSRTQIARIAANKITTWPVALPAGSTPFTILSQPDSRFLIGFDHGGKYWTRQGEALEPAMAGLDIHCLLRARDGNIWLGTTNRGLLHSFPGSRTLLETGVSDRFITALAEDRTGAIWAGSASGGGLYRLAGEQVQNFGRQEGLRSPNVYTLFVDGKGELWIGSTNGLSWFQNGLIRTVSSREGLPSDQVWAIVDDSYGRLWFTGYGGITAIEKKSLAEWAAGRRHRLTPTVYRSADGLQVNTVGRVFPNAVRSTNGHLWFSIADGVAEVTPPNPDAPHGSGFQVLIEDAVVDHVPHSGREPIRIPPGARSVELRYTALTLSSPETVRFRYRLDGFDNDWIDADARRTAFYNNLKPRAYTFRVSASAGEEQWREAPPLVLEQLPFFYQTSWFALLTSAAVLSVAWFGYRLRLQQAVDRIQIGFQERMDERTRIAQELHDTILQAIAGSAMIVESAADNVPDSLPLVKGTVLRAADRLGLALAESRAALKGLRGSAALENNLAKQLSEVASDATSHDTAFHLVITGESRGIRPAIQYEVFRISAEAIGNAFKHSAATSIRVELGYLNGLRVSVRDNGKGISENVLRGGRDGHFGLEGMRERADRIGAALDVYSRSGEGTEIDLVVPDDVAFDPRGANPSLLARAVSRVAALNRRPTPEDSRLV